MKEGRYLVTELSELLLKGTSPERTSEIVEYIHNHPKEFEQVLNAAFSKQANLKQPLLDLADFLNGTLMVQIIEKSIMDDDIQIRKRGLQAAYRTRVDSLNLYVVEILSNPKEEFDAREWALHILGSTDPDY